MEEKYRLFSLARQRREQAARAQRLADVASASDVAKKLQRQAFRLTDEARRLDEQAQSVATTDKGS